MLLTIHNMLSNVSIKKFLETKDIIIDPWEIEMLEAARITLHLGAKILIPQKGVVDIKKNKLPKYKETAITENKPLPLKPGMFILGETLELIGLSEKVGMLIEGRSTIARLGISVVQASMIVDSGQNPKKMTLEIFNAGPNTILLYKGMRFCRGCFFKLLPAATIRYDTKGRYKGDSNKPIFRDDIKKSQ